MEPEVESKVISLIEDLQKRMISLEKKMDILVKQSSEKPLNGQRSAAGGSRTRESQRYNDKRESRFGAKNARSGSSFHNEKKRRDEGRVFPKKNQSFIPVSKKRSDKSK